MPLGFKMNNLSPLSGYPKNNKKKDDLTVITDLSKMSLDLSKQNYVNSN